MTGATPVFVDIDPATGSLDLDAAAAALTERTRAIYVVHYGGVAPDMDRLTALAARAGIQIVETTRTASAPGGVVARAGASARSLRRASTRPRRCSAERTGSSHQPAVAAGTRGGPAGEGNGQSRFLRGEVDKYNWIDHGSSYLPSELTVAVLAAQLEVFDVIQAQRHAIWDTYSKALVSWAAQTGTQLMSPPEQVEHPAHVFYLLTPDAASRPMMPSPCPATDDFAARIIRLPLWPGMSCDEVDRVVTAVQSFEPALV